MYLEYFGLREKPFHITPDPRFFYPSLVGQEAYASLFYGITEKKGFVVLTGEVGTGKTTLLRRLMFSLVDSVSFAFVYNTTWTFDEVLDAICHEFALPLPTSGKRSEKVQALNSFLLDQLVRGMTATVLVDEAHNLSVDVLENLRLLSNLETASEKLLQIVLVGQNELEVKLLQPDLRQVKDRISIWTRLNRLKKREIRSFIFHRLHVAGYEKEDLFTPEAIDRIAIYSQGSPRQINIICDNALLTAYGTYQHQVCGDIIEEVAQDLGLAYKKSKSDVLLFDSKNGMASPVKELTQLDVNVGTPSRRNLEIHQKEEIWESERKREHQTPLPASVRSKFTRYLTFFMLSSGAVGIIAVFLFQGAGASLIEPNSLVSRIANLFQARRRPAKQEVLLHSTATSPPPSNLSGISKHKEEEPQKETKAKTDDNVFSAAQSDNVFKLREVTSPVFPVPEQPERMEQLNFNSAVSLQSPERHDEQTALLESRLQSGQFVIMSRGVTILALVSRLYGNHSLLVLDLLKESNPQITDLDKLFAGDRLWIPPLTRETLLHHQLDGSYRLRFSSFRQKREAERCRRALLAQGYTAVVMPQQISSTLKLYRVEIKGLREAAIETAWELALTEDFAFLTRSKRKASIETEPDLSSQG